MAVKKYIELQKALNVCKMQYEHCLEMHDWSGDATADNIKRDIETLPTADVVEVKHAKWEINYDGYYPYCSNCKTEPKNGVLSKHCPECGAKMDGQKDGENNG